MTRLAVLVPDEVINHITNPSMRYDTTGWNVQGSTLTRSLDQARFGIASLKVVTTRAALREGVFFRVSALSGISDSVTVSAYVRGTGKVRIRLDNNVLGGTEYSSQRVDLDSARWQRISVTGFSTGGNDMRLFVETDENTAISRTFYVDGAQMERKPYVTTYCDGDQTGCRWNGVQHAAVSERFDYSRQGGRWVELAGEEREAEDLYMTLIGGMGLPQTTLDMRDYSISPGGFRLGRKILPRLITFTFHAKHRVEDSDQPVSLAALHALRQLLIDLINPDSGRKEEVTFLYDDGLPLLFRARYDGGLDGEWDIRNQFVNSFPLRVLAADPFMVEDSRDVQVLDFQDSVGAVVLNDLIGRIDGEWNVMNYGTNGATGDMELSQRGVLYISGSFSFVNNDPNAIDSGRAADFIAYWDGEKWNAVGNGLALGTVINDIAIAPNGDVYVTGAFTSIGGVAANNIAYWNGTAWNALGTGLNSDGLHVSIAPNGDVYAGGQFTQAGGVTANYIARWGGFQWRPIGQFSGLDNYVNSISISLDGTKVYVGGTFLDQPGFVSLAMLRIAEYDVATDRFTQVGQGFNSNVLEVLQAENGALYACGDFTASGTTTINHIAKFEGGTWIPLGDGMDAPVYSFDVGVNGDIIAVGIFDHAGGVDARRVALWNGSTWVNLDVDIAIGTSAVYLLSGQYQKNGDVILGGFGLSDGPAAFSAINYVENIGSSDAGPVVYILGPGRMRFLENQTTRQRVFFNLDVLDGEEVFIDFADGRVFSTQRGNLFHSVLPGSDFHAFRLAPGRNKLAVYMTNDVEAQMQIGYTPTHWGADAVPVSVI